MLVSKLEKSIGIQVYATSSLGVGGAIRCLPEDFLVEEILMNGLRAKIDFPETLVKQSLESPSKAQRYLLCVLIKRNWDNLQAVKAVANRLGISTQRISIAGIKDAHAVTAQHITIDDAALGDVEKVEIKDLKVIPIRYFHTRLSPHYLFGNSFRITVRALVNSETVIKERTLGFVEQIELLGGVPNFFGHQRFGTIRPITHLVGKALIKGSFRKAAMLFLARPSRNEHPESRKAREMLWKTQNFEKAAEVFPKNLRYERLMLRHLARKPEDFSGAFKRLPMKLRKLFPQAYQAYLFNKMLSRRIVQGLSLNKAEVGDFVVSVEPPGLPNPLRFKVASQETISEVNNALKFGKMFLALPLPGYRQIFSEGMQGEIEKTILEEEGVTPEQFKVRGAPELSLKGGLRTALSPLKDFCLHEISRDEFNLHKKKAVISFTLQRGSYATIVLREIMKPRNLLKAGF